MRLKPILLLVTVSAVLAAAKDGASWNGSLDKSSSIGLVLDVAEYDQAGFALMEQGGDALEQLFPEVPWEVLDSSMPNLTPGRLDSLTSLGDTADGSALKAKALGSELGKSHILVVRRGGKKALRDSAAQFDDSIGFTLWDASKGTLLLKQEFHTKGDKGKLSAESQWAKDAWERFKGAVKATR
jgi:hypothetical protein